jgi:hypothetical protein
VRLLVHCLIRSLFRRFGCKVGKRCAIKGKVLRTLKVRSDHNSLEKVCRGRDRKSVQARRWGSQATSACRFQLIEKTPSSQLQVPITITIDDQYAYSSAAHLRHSRHGSNPSELPHTCFLLLSTYMVKLQSEKQPFYCSCHTASKYKKDLDVCRNHEHIPKNHQTPSCIVWEHFAFYHENASSVKSILLTY